MRSVLRLLIIITFYKYVTAHSTFRARPAPMGPDTFFTKLRRPKSMQYSSEYCISI